MKRLVKLENEKQTKANAIKLLVLNKKIIIITSILVAFVIIMISVIITSTTYPLKYRDEIGYISKKYDVKAELIAGIVYAESNFNSSAISPKGAIGIMQILPETAEWICGVMKIPYSERMLFNPLYNIEIGTFYLTYLKEKFSGANAYVAAYNAGEGNVKLWLENDKYTQNGDIKTTPFKQTNAYIEKVNKATEYYKKVFSN
jgi:soluble lytic murein transglycosylase